MAETAPVVSFSVARVTTNSTAMSITNGRPNPISNALFATFFDTDTVTQSPVFSSFRKWEPLISISFSLLSEALQYPATLQEAQAEVCRILTFTPEESTESTTPE